jgi:predicted nuclease of predicted toxin-antitoxin system
MRRILLDQGLPVGAVTRLREGGWDVVHVREIGMRDAADVDILAHAATDDRVIITLDRDFPQILALTAAARPSVVLIRQQRLRGAEVAALIVNVWRQHELALDRGCVLTVSARGSRVHPLPLR